MNDNTADYFIDLARDVMMGVGIWDWPRAGEIHEAYARKLADRAEEATSFTILFQAVAEEMVRNSLTDVLETKGFDSGAVGAVNHVLRGSRNEITSGRQISAWVNTSRKEDRFAGQDEQTPVQQLLMKAAQWGLNTANLVAHPHLDEIQKLCEGRNTHDVDKLLAKLCARDCWILDDHDSLREHIAALRANPGIELRQLANPDLLPAIAIGATCEFECQRLIDLRNLIARKADASKQEVLDRMAQLPFKEVTLGADLFDQMSLAVHGQPQGADLDDIIEAVEKKLERKLG